MENPPKVNRTVPYRAVPCSGKAPLEDNFQLGQGLESCGRKCLSVSDADDLLPPLSDEPSLWMEVINNAS